MQVAAGGRPLVRSANLEGVAVGRWLLQVSAGEVVHAHGIRGGCRHQFR